MLLAAAFGMTLHTGRSASSLLCRSIHLYDEHLKGIYNRSRSEKSSGNTEERQKWTATYQTSGNTSTYQLTASGYESQAAANASAAALKRSGHERYGVSSR